MEDDPAPQAPAAHMRDPEDKAGPYLTPVHVTAIMDIVIRK